MFLHCHWAHTLKFIKSCSSSRWKIATHVRGKYYLHTLSGVNVRAYFLHVNIKHWQQWADTLRLKALLWRKATPVSWFSLIRLVKKTLWTRQGYHFVFTAVRWQINSVKELYTKQVVNACIYYISNGHLLVRENPYMGVLLYLTS